MSFNDWQEVRIGDVVQFNPKESIRKSEIVKKVAMEKLEPFTRKITGYEEIGFNSGSKFRNGDTLLARITPCLENGKTAQVDILNKNEVGFGSTEFIVLREKLGVTDNNFIYYLSISPEFRNLAIKSMNGSSGRQRVQKDVLEQCIISLPSLKEQKAIAHILSMLDSKMEVNNQINKNLDEIAQSIFKQWFVNFEFPTEEGVPYKLSGGEFHSQNGVDSPIEWEISNVFDNVQLVKDKNKNSEEFPVLTVVKEGRFLCSEEYFSKQVYSKDTSNYKIVDKYDIAYNPSRANIGSIAMLKEFDRGLVSPMYVVFRLGEKILPFYFDYYMRLPGFIERIALNSSGTTRQNFDFNAFKDFTLIIPPMDIQERAYKIIKSIEDLINKNVKENEKLKDIRDTLIPKLMSGEVRVPIEFNEN